jgi:hypothetical protein
MRKLTIFSVGLLILFLSLEITSADQQWIKQRFPEVPWISAFEAAKKLKEGKAILIHAGGQDFKKRHIGAAMELYENDIRNGNKKLPPFPKQGMDILIYCY